MDHLLVTFFFDLSRSQFILTYSFEQFKVSHGAKTVPKLTPEQLATFIDGRKGGDGVRKMTATFNLGALQSVASKTMNDMCTGITLIAEGLYIIYRSLAST